ncbi:hypothetical protein OZ666_11080 [Elizabethkingia sp. HX QKY]|uniref:hypothetical protein n=1 Tax=Elizabethkingia TaxID=308865 RepID=UPI002A23AE0C|nr:hypothetical protein [Elizabethkingia sp. HX QKY]MDX8572226.1 hypothetical protein [Elizabethkingia sp. HX QKY]
MLRKFVAIFFLIVAQIMILGHSVVWHTHHSDIDRYQHNVPNNKVHHDDNTETPVQHALSTFTHVGQYISFPDSVEISKNGTKSIKNLFIDFNTFSECIGAEQKCINLFDGPPIYFLSLSRWVYQLRGPPSISIA